MEVSALESFLGSLLICEILQGTGKMSGNRINKTWRDFYLFHHKVPPNNDFADGLPISWDVPEVFPFGLVNDTCSVSGGVAVSLPSHELRSFFQGELQP